MQLDRLSVALRPRNSWEAIDLGLQMARSRFFKLWLLWWLSALPVSLLVMLLLHAHPAYISTAVWWCKPLFEPILVYWLSRAVFQEDPTLRELRSDWWQVTRRRLPGNLLWRRFSPNRSLFMPIALLEQPDNKSWRTRTGLFTRSDSGGFWLTLIGVHFEAVIALSLVFGVALLIPEQLLPHWDWFDWVDEDNTLMAWIWAVASIFAMSLIAPFYVAGGFGLYLSRRTSLEAWDIELSFRRLLERLPVPSVLPLFLLFILPLVGPTPVQADSLREDSRRTIEQVLASEDFGGEEEVTRWVFKDDDEPDSKDFRFDADLGWLVDLLQLLAWLAVAALVAWLVVQLMRYRERLRAPGVSQVPLRETSLKIEINGIDDLTQLPADIPAAVQDCLQRGEQRLAVSLLYRASLFALVQHHALDLGDSATEGECLALVRQRRPQDESDFFGRLTHAWIRIAYADLLPSSQSVQQLLDDWISHYGNPHGAVA